MVYWHLENIPGRIKRMITSQAHDTSDTEQRLGDLRAEIARLESRRRERPRAASKIKLRRRRGHPQRRARP
jgi:hypothetical protein